MPLNCWAFLDGRFTTASGTGDFRPSGRSADRSESSSTPYRKTEARLRTCRRASTLCKSACRWRDPWPSLIPAAREIDIPSQDASPGQLRASCSCSRPRRPRPRTTRASAPISPTILRWDRSPSGSSSTARGRRSMRSRRATTCRLPSTCRAGRCSSSTPASSRRCGRTTRRIICRATSGSGRRSRPPTSRASAPTRCGRVPTTRGR